ASTGEAAAATGTATVAAIADPFQAPGHPASGVHDGGGHEHHDGNSAPRRRSRNRSRRSAPAAE
ncbi:MAG TPA: hypothetical protein VIP54_03035, partial [Microterricola sp.]